MGSKRVRTYDLTPGLIAADDVYTFNDQLIIQEGTRVTDRVITRLKFYAVPDIKVYTDEDTDEDELPPEDEAVIFSYDKPYRDQVMATPEFKIFGTAYSISVDHLSDSLDDIAMGKKPASQDELLEVVSSSLANVRNNVHLFDMLNCMHDMSDIVYVHSLNVALISHALGIWIEMPEDDLAVLTTAALLHDIGKLLVPSEILNKPGSLNAQEYAIVKTHAQFGYNILKNQDQLDDRIKNAVLQHHERCDGSGYPVGLHSTEIDDFAKIIAIADVYDAMSSKRTYREPICPFSVIEMFEKDGLQKYDPHFVLTFRQGVVETYLHNDVVLTDGREGEVVLINKLDLSRPVIRLKDSTYVDLSKERDIAIRNVI